VLLVANHPNSLLDPIIVLAAARRDVRLLAKAPLFADPKTAWLMRLGAAIPVHRASDDPSKMADNAAMFRAVHQALASGDAVGLFPEGISHAAPAMAPLRTGAARMALGAAALVGGGFPVVPVGLTLRDRDIFRSEARVVIGAPVAWDDLALRGADDVEAVRELTARIAAALSGVTLNLEHWEDEPLVSTAVRVWEAERAATPDAAERAARLSITTRILASVRAQDDVDGSATVRAVAEHHRRLTRMRLRPADLVADVGWWRSASWAARRLPFVLPVWLVLGVAGWALFLVPYQLTGIIVGRVRLEADTRSTWKFLVGGGLYTVWVIGLAVVAGLTWNLWAAFSVLVAVPAIGMAGLLVRERWRGAWADVRRFVLLRGRRRLFDTLRAEQRALADRLEGLYQRHISGDTT
jgi:1-acyl-sn-glycerol-3-phosphate acyltransferase